MSWSAFDEFKTFATKIKEQCKRKKDWNRPASKKQRSSDNGSVKIEEGIDKFSSDDDDDDKQTLAQQPSHARKYKLENSSKKRSPRTCNPRKRIRTETDPHLGELIEDSEDTPENISNATNVADNSSKYQGACDEEKQLLETLDEMIKDFNSSDEEEKKESEELDINTPTPTPTASTDSTSTPTVKKKGVPGLTTTGSAWLKKVQHVTSTSIIEDDMSTTTTEVDSAKKVKLKFKRSGLAEQLQKIINREKSEKTFWNHKLQSSADNIQDSNSCLDVQILYLQVQYSLHIARCRLLPSNDSSMPPVIDVMFNTESCKQVVPRVGGAVRIHPPWQKLQPPSSPYPILLCTYYCEKLDTPPGSPDIDNVLSLTADIGNIPIQTDKATSCLSQSHQKSFKPTKLFFDGSTDTTLYSPNEVSNANTEKKSISQAIESQGGCSGECVSFKAVVQRIYRKRVKVAREKGVESPGHLAMSKSLIMRARSGEDNEEIRWTILVQDSSSNLCEIQIPEKLAFHEQWLSCIRNGEGELFNFTDLVVTQRTNRTRSPGLFTLVDSLWCNSFTSHSSDEKTSQIDSSQDMSSQSSHCLSSPPSYCYVLTAQEDSDVTPCEIDNAYSSVYRMPAISSLQHLSSFSLTPRRFSLWCRVICSQSSKISSPNQNCQSWTGQLFVTDASLHQVQTQEAQCRTKTGPTQGSLHSVDTSSTQEAHDVNQYVKIDVRPSHAITESLYNAVCNTGGVFYFQDIVCSGIGLTLYADCYTTIKRGAIDPCQADLDMGDVKTMPLEIYTDLVALRTLQSIRPLSSNSICESLCKIEGIVQGVDEESACCWLECPVCSCQDLLERNSLQYYCPVCKEDVINPSTKTNLDVFVKCDTWTEARIKVKLLQATIKKLLPVSYQESDQGYDIDRVLEKHIGPLYCFVEKHHEQTATLSEINISL